MNYLKLVNSVKSLLGIRAGQLITIRTYSLGTYSTTTGLNTATYTDTTAYGIIFPTTDGMLHQNGTEIAQTDKILLIYTTTTITLSTIIILADSSPHSVVSIIEFSPAGTLLYYKLRLRK